MQKTISLTLLPALVAVSIAASAAIPCEWVADVDRPAAAAFPVLRGETIRLSAALVRHGAPYDPAAASAALFYQTNGMGSQWWSAPATVSSNVISADFTPAMDPGAPLVTAFLAANAPSGNVYRAFATLRFLHAPGAVPNALPLPVRVIDFSAVHATNAPWTLPTDVAAAIAAALDGTTNHILTINGWPLSAADSIVFTNRPGSAVQVSVFERRSVVDPDSRRLGGIQFDLSDEFMEVLDSMLFDVYADATNYTATATNAAIEYADSAAATALDAAKTYAISTVSSAISGYQPHDSTALGTDSAAASAGGAWGSSATATATGAYQIGQGVNATANTLQFRGYQLLDASGAIPEDRLPSDFRTAAHFWAASSVLWRDLAERVEILEGAQ